MDLHHTSVVSPSIHLPATTPRRGARSPSPDRLAVPKYHTLDPLLQNLSPESTLQALSSVDAVPRNEQTAHDILSKSIAQVSAAERALAIRAAVAAQHLSLWYKEVQAWQWPKRNDAHLGKGFIPPETDSEEYCGSLPAAVLAQHVQRIEEIRDGMDGLDVEELKEHVLNAHIPARSRPSSANSTVSMPPPLSYVQLSDFTAVITATILRALPLLSRLNNLLSTWDVRLLVLSQIPALLRALRATRSELDSALDMLKSSVPPCETDALYSRENYHAKRNTLESAIVSTGRRLDRVLDALEGREDSLPEQWIDDLESMEADFGTWVVEAERRAVENEWRRMLAAKSEQSNAEHNKDQSPAIEDNAGDKKEPITETPEPTSPAGEIAREEEPTSFVDPSPSTSNDLPEQSVPTPPESKVATTIDRSNIVDLPLKTHAEPRETHPAPEPAISGAPITANVDGIDSEDTFLKEHHQHQETVPVSDITPVSTGDVSAEKPAQNALPSAQSGIVETIEQPAELPVIPEDEWVDAADAKSLPEQSSAESSVIVQKASEGSDSNGQSDEIPSSCSQEQKGLPEKRQELGVSELSPLPKESTLEIPKSGKRPLVDHLSSTQIEDPFGPVESVPTLKVDSETPMSQNPSSVPNYPFTEDRDEPGDASGLGNNEPVHRLPTSVADSEQLQTKTSETAEAPTTCKREQSPSVRSGSSSLASSPHDEKSKKNTEIQGDEKAEPSKKPLESPIKLSKTRPGRLNLDQDHAKGRRRRASNTSAGSLSDYPSLVSSPEAREPPTTSSDGTPAVLETPPQSHPDYQPADPTPAHHDHTLREDRLVRLDNQKTPPPTAIKHNRTLSLPLQRFLNLNDEHESGEDPDKSPVVRRATRASADLRLHTERRAASHKSRSSTPTNFRRIASENTHQRPNSSHGRLLKPWEHTKNSFQKNSRPASPADPPTHSTTSRLRTQLTAHPSLESIGRYSSISQSRDDASSSVKEKPASRSSTPNSHRRKRKDHLDEKISSILNTIPTRIHLMSADDQDDDAVSVASSLPLRARERFRSVSPSGTPSRSGTPAPSLTLKPAPTRRRHSHAPEESSVKLYHLHQGGKTKPTKLFVRSVGENGERVMVRVGGGWADLGEYLREYAIHHGRRHVSETPRVEVQGLSSRDTTPTYISPGSRLTPGNNGHNTPSRPPSVISNRPASSLAVRKKRRPSNASDATDLRASTTGEPLNVSISPMSTLSSANRRLSTSSNVSAGAISSVSEFRHTSGTSQVPLGLAGPKPRSRQVSMTPESEAWVEDVLGQARRSSSLRPFKYDLPPLEQEPDLESPHDQAQPGDGGKDPGLPKSRSISDIGKAGSSRRVQLRGLPR